MDKPKLLILDDEQEILNALNRVLRKEFQLFLFSDPTEALLFYREHPIPLVITDMRMPVMDGVTFLSKLIEITPHSKRFLLTGHADINSTVNAVNEGKITHYFAKPWDNSELIAELKMAYELFLNERKTKHLLKLNQEKNAQLSLINGSLELETTKHKKKLQLLSGREAKSFGRLKKTFSTFIDIYADTISFHTLDQTRHNYRVASHAKYLAERIQNDKLITFQIHVAGLLYESGKLSLHQNLLSIPVEMMNQQERSQYDGFYQESQKLLAKVDELNYVSEIIQHIPECFNGLGHPDHLAEEEIPLGSRIIAIVSMYDNLLIGRQSQFSLSTVEAQHRIKQLSNTVFDEKIVNLYTELLNKRSNSPEDKIEYLVNIAELNKGDILARDIKNKEGATLLTAGVELEQHNIDKLLEIEKIQNEKFTIAVQGLDGE